MDSDHVRRSTTQGAGGRAGGQAGGQTGWLAGRQAGKRPGAKAALAPSSPVVLQQHSHSLPAAQRRPDSPQSQALLKRLAGLASPGPGLIAMSASARHGECLHTCLPAAARLTCIATCLCIAAPLARVDHALPVAVTGDVALLAVGPGPGVEPAAVAVALHVLGIRAVVARAPVASNLQGRPAGAHMGSPMRAACTKREGALSGARAPLPACRGCQLRCPHSIMRCSASSAPSCAPVPCGRQWPTLCQPSVPIPVLCLQHLHLPAEGPRGQGQMCAAVSVMPSD